MVRQGTREYLGETMPADPSKGQRFPPKVQRFRGGLVIKAYRLVDHSTLGMGVMKKKKKVPFIRGHIQFGFLFVHSSLTSLAEMKWSRNSVPR